MSGEHYASTQKPKRPDDCLEANRKCKNISLARKQSTADSSTSYYQCSVCDFTYSEVVYKDIQERPGEAQRFA